MLPLVPLLNGIAFSGAALKQQFNELINRKSKKIEMKNRTYYFYNDIINIKEFKFTKNSKKSYKDIDIYYIGYITILKSGDCMNI